MRKYASIIKAFSKARICVIGDMTADVFIYGKPYRLSREAPVIVVRYDSEELVPGGAANTVNNLLDLGAQVFPVGLLGRDYFGEKLFSVIADKCQNMDGMILEPGYHTIMKTRILAGDDNTTKQQVIRIDRDFETPLTGENEQHLLAYLKRILPNKQVLPYLDMPLQHAHPRTLYRMRRPSNIDWVHKTLGKMRSAISNLAIRTTFIVGYPGETEEEFQALLDFVAEIRFDRVGAFQFSFEPGTTSEPLGDTVSSEVKQERYERLMELQQNISLQINQSYVGKKLDVLVEGVDNGLAIGRSYRDAPEIDGLVIIEGDAVVGEIIPVGISGAMAYDLTGAPAQPDKMPDLTKLTDLSVINK